jgi:DNA repair exonuclease SbcCD nuclease subunit
MPLRILLTSDLHLGLKFAGYPEVQDRLIEARFRTLRRLVDHANHEKCDLFVIAGDLFDRVSVAKRDALRALKILKEFEGALVVVLPGNHDFVSADKGDLWHYFSEEAPGNVLVPIESKVYQLQTYDLDVHLYAAPCTAKHSDIDTIHWIKDYPKDTAVRHHIGVAHGSLEGFSPDFDQRYYPMTVQELHEAGIDLWLMGHTHIPYPQKPGSSDRIFYPGTPEPDGFDCDHAGSAWLLDVDENKRVSSRLIQTGMYRFVHQEIEIRKAADLKRLSQSFTTPSSINVLLKLKVRGSLPGDDYHRLAEAKDEIRKKILHLIFDDEVTEEITIERINQEFTEGSFPHRLLRALAQEPEALQLAHQLITEVQR